VGRCGKSTNLELLEMACHRPRITSNISPAALYRLIETCRPTILIDEADTHLIHSTELRNVLNAGHKRGGRVTRVDQGDTIRDFDVFSPVVIACIGDLPATLADRSINIRMQRATRAERRPRIGPKTAETAAILARKAASWCADIEAALADADPCLPEWMDNRIGDNWRILFALAEAAGGVAGRRGWLLLPKLCRPEMMGVKASQ
jgi:hypothetical protein